MTRVILEAAVSIPTTRQAVMTAMLAPRLIPVQVVPAWEDLRRTVMMGMSVQPIAVMPLPGVKTAIIPIPVMTAMPARRQIAVQVVLVWADHLRTVTMVMSVPMTRVILWVVASIPTTPQCVMTAMPVPRRISVQVVPA